VALLAAALMPAGASAQTAPEARRWAQEGLAHYRQGRYLQAAEALEKARDLLPRDAEISYALGTSWLHANRYEAARREFLRFLEVEPEAVRPRLGLARIAVRLGDYDEAERRYREALARQPDDGIALYNLAWLLYRSADYVEAKDLLERMLARSRDHAEARYTLGMTHLRLGDDAAAERELRRAVAIDPEHRKAHFNLMNLYLRTGRAEEAAREEAAFSRLADRLAADRALEGTARDRFLAGDYPAALSEYDRLLRVNPRSGRYQLGRGLCLLKLGRREEGMRALESAAALDPQLPDVYYHLAAAYQEAGEVEKSREARARYETLESFGVSRY
jgi:tetratricopeptide (TPR) repeat protein